MQLADPASWLANVLLTFWISSEACTSTLSKEAAPQKQQIQHHFPWRAEDLELQLVVRMLIASSKEFSPLKSRLHS